MFTNCCKDCAECNLEEKKREFKKTIMPNVSIIQPDLEPQDPTETDEDDSSITLRGISSELYSSRENCVNLFCFLMAGNPEMQK